MPDHKLLTYLFYGAILTATSVSVTVATLKELGKLNTKVGTSIVAAAVIDDIIGIVILSVLTGFTSTESSGVFPSRMVGKRGMVAGLFEDRRVLRHRDSARSVSTQGVQSHGT